MTNPVDALKQHFESLEEIILDRNTLQSLADRQAADLAMHKDMLTQLRTELTEARRERDWYMRHCTEITTRFDELAGFVKLLAANQTQALDALHLIVATTQNNMKLGQYRPNDPMPPEPLTAGDDESPRVEDLKLFQDDASREALVT